MVRKELADTIRCVHAGRKRIPAEIAVKMAEHHSDDALTDREIEILRQVAAGNANKAIADELSKLTWDAPPGCIITKVSLLGPEASAVPAPEAGAAWGICA